MLAAVFVAALWLCASAVAQTAATAASAAQSGQMSAAGPSEPVSSSAPKVSSSNPEVQSLGHQLMCMCGCDQILVECTHQGSDRCVMHDRMMAELEQRVAGGQSKSLILQSFVQEYGPQVLVVPPAHGFDLTAWLMPIFAGLVGLALALFIVQRWRGRALVPAMATAGGPKTRVRPELLAKARAEAEKEDY